jgi:hypothetical protein
MADSKSRITIEASSVNVDDGILEGSSQPFIIEVAYQEITFARLCMIFSSSNLK